MVFNAIELVEVTRGQREYLGQAKMVGQEETFSRAVGHFILGLDDSSSTWAKTFIQKLFRHNADA